MSVAVTVDHDELIIEHSKPHNGKPITELEISPNGKYLVTYSEDDRSIIGWDVKDIDKVNDIKTSTELDEGRLKPDITVETVKIDSNHKLNKICVSDDKKLVRVYTHKNRNFLSK